MASTVVGHAIPSSVSSIEQYFNSNKHSLYDIEKQKNHYKLSFIHRLVYVAKIVENPNGEDRRGEIVEHYEKFLSTFLKNMFMDGITGLLLLYTHSVIHLLETSSEIQIEILKDLCTMEENPDSPLKDFRIMAVSHCIDNRTFPTWRYRLLHPSIEDSEPQTEPVEILVPDSLSLLYRLCVHFLNRRGSFTEEDEEEHDLHVDENTVLHLCRSSVLHSPSTFLQAYNKPLNFLMDSEIVCPAQRRIYW